jgi:hypothetical protein
MGGCQVADGQYNVAISQVITRMRKTPQDLANYSNEIQQLIDNQLVDNAYMELEDHHMYVSHNPIHRRDKYTKKILPVF